MAKYDASETLKKIYGTDYIDKEMPGYTPIKNSNKTTPALLHYLDEAFFYIRQKLNLSQIIRELTFVMICFISLIYMIDDTTQHHLKSIGLFISFLLLLAAGFQLFKASCKSFFPAFLCLALGLFYSKTGFNNATLKLLSITDVSFFYGLGAFYLSIAVLCDKGD